MQSIFRVLIVEDNLSRIHRFQEWIPAGMRAVIATSAGQAMGILRRDRGNVYGAVLLDHDLQERVASESDRLLSGRDVADVVIENVSKDVPILIHSMNTAGARGMADALKRAGFDVTVVPMSCLDREAVVEWLKEAREQTACGPGPDEEIR
jgi:hypothetical protein